MSFSIISLLVELKNAYLVKKDSIEVPYTKFRENMGRFLLKEGYLKDVNKFKKGKFNYLHFDLLIGSPKSNELVRNLRIISKPGQKIYYSLSDLTRLLEKGNRNVILSTSRGLMNVSEAKKKRLGGEAICNIG